MRGILEVLGRIIESCRMVCDTFQEGLSGREIIANISDRRLSRVRIPAGQARIDRQPVQGFQ